MVDSSKMSVKGRTDSCRAGSCNKTCSAYLKSRRDDMASTSIIFSPWSSSSASGVGSWLSALTLASFCSSFLGSSQQDNALNHPETSRLSMRTNLSWSHELQHSHCHLETHSLPTSLTQLRHRHRHTHTHTHTLSLSLSLSLSLALSFSV